MVYRGVAGLDRDIGGLLGERLDKFKVVVMPDFFIDRIVELPSLEVFLREVRSKIKSGGGSVHRLEQTEIRGGNAANTAYALGRLGLSVDLIAVADRYSELFLRSVFSSLTNVRIDTIKGEPGYTVSLEFPHKGRIVNVMLSDVGDISKAGPDMMPVNYSKRISEADVVGVFNWAANMKGSELAEDVFSKASEKSVSTYFAPADLSGRKEEIPGLFSRLRGILKILSINENEARVMGKALSVKPLPADYRPKDTVRSAELLSEVTGTRIDIHTPFGSASSYEGETHFAEVFKVEQNICTGAGDVWDAVNITGYLLQIEPDDRLKLANAAAGLYISSNEAESPSREQITSFLKVNFSGRKH